MNKQNRAKYTLLAILAVLSLAALACNMPATTLGQPTSEATLPPVVQGSPSEGSQTITLSATEINQIIADALEQQPSLPVQNLVITLDNGQFGATGQVRQGSLNMPVELIASVGIDGAGGLLFQITEANLGPFPLPAEYRTQINTLLNEGLKQPIGEATDDIYIESIVIDDGVAVISGRAK